MRTIIDIQLNMTPGVRLAWEALLDHILALRANNKPDATLLVGPSVRGADDE